MKLAISLLLSSASLCFAADSASSAAAEGGNPAAESGRGAELVIVVGGKEGRVNFSHPDSMSVYGGDAKPYTAIVSEGVKTIGANVAMGAMFLTKLKLPSTLTKIGTCAFYDSGLNGSLDLSMVSHIGLCAFGGTQLTVVKLSGKLIQLGEDAFPRSLSDIITVGELQPGILAQLAAQYPNIKFFKEQ